QSKPIETTQSKPVEQPKTLDPLCQPCQTCEKHTNAAIVTRPPLLSRVNTALARPEPPLYMGSSSTAEFGPTGPVMQMPPPGSPGSTSNPIVVTEPTPRIVEPARGWRPGDLLFGRRTTPAPIVATAEPKLSDSSFLAA